MTALNACWKNCLTSLWLEKMLRYFGQQFAIHVQPGFVQMMDLSAMKEESELLNQVVV